MITIDLNKRFRKYIAEISSQSNSDTKILAIVDTGAVTSVLVDSNIRMLLGDNVSDYENALKDENKHMLKAFNGTSIPTTPIVINGCTLNGAKLQKLYCLACNDPGASISVIGMDFITACSYNVGKESDMVLSTIDYELYEANFISDCSGTKIHEVNLLSSGNSMQDLFEQIEGNK